MAQTGWGEKGAWAVAWQAEKNGYFVEFIVPHRVKRYVDTELGGRVPQAPNLTFGLSDSMEEAMGKVELAIRTDADFALRWRGGIFRPVPYHVGIGLPKDGSMQVVGA